ncbi:DoxX family protein [Nocardioides sp. Root140]|uniref:DoxX family protein n=1 Tax=Nocardioides sp. Root140 TaxID=1736460 RepID=UPI0006F599C4|nr:DoxX family membrane protein [Nocardioides sp. Root140]KQY57319.1 hypothetical protein ASD30_13935 [Nocardioides sp. Root140]
MVPLLILVLVTVAVRLAGGRGPSGARPWPSALRFGLAAMFTVTGCAHFVGMRDDLIAMVPPSLPSPGTLVTLTGVLELLGAVGLVWRRTTGTAAAALGLLMVAMFPANVYAATHGLIAEWTDHLVPRTILQIVYVAATALVARHHWSQTKVEEGERAPAGPR